MRLVEKTVNQDDVRACRLSYADGPGSPGTDLTFFDWSMAARERRGTHSIVRTGLRVGDLRGSEVLVLLGRNDPRRATGNGLPGLLQRAGTSVEDDVLGAGHNPTDEDVTRLAARFAALGARGSCPARSARPFAPDGPRPGRYHGPVGGPPGRRPEGQA